MGPAKQRLSSALNAARRLPVGQRAAYLAQFERLAAAVGLPDNWIRDVGEDGLCVLAATLSSDARQEVCSHV